MSYRRILLRISIFGFFLCRVSFAGEVAPLTEVYWACELKCSGFKGVQQLSDQEDLNTEPPSVEGAWKDNALVVSNADYIRLIIICKAAKPYVAAKSFGKIMDPIQLDLDVCEDRPVALGQFGWRPYEVKPMGQVKDEL